MSKYKLKSHVRVINGSLKGYVGEIVDITDRPGDCPIYIIKVDRVDGLIKYAETDIEAEDILNEPDDGDLIKN